MTSAPPDGAPLTDRSGGPPRVLTIGYGNRPVEAVLELLRRERVGLVIDVRSAPWSRHRPEFRHEALAATVGAVGIEATWLGDALGGRPDDPSLSERGRLVAERAREQPAFRAGIERVAALARAGRRPALLCGCQRPETCHRSHLLGPPLIAAGLDLRHLDHAGDLVDHATIERRRDGGQMHLGWA